MRFRTARRSKRLTYFASVVHHRYPLIVWDKRCVLCVRGDGHSVMKLFGIAFKRSVELSSFFTSTQFFYCFLRYGFYIGTRYPSDFLVAFSDSSPPTLCRTRFQ